MSDFEMYLEGYEDGDIGIICTAEACMKKGTKTPWNPKGLWFRDVSGDLPYRPNPADVKKAWDAHLADAHPDKAEHPFAVSVRHYLHNAGITPETLRYAATHEALSRNFIFDLLTNLADVLEEENQR